MTTTTTVCIDYFVIVDIATTIDNIVVVIVVRFIEVVDGE